MADTETAPGGPPDMTLCESSMVHSHAYNPETGQLWIRFQHERSLYRYDSVPESVYKDMLEAPSIGKFVTRNVLKQYPGVRIEEN